ncbi:MmcQ/YjbR family DNA-binding protein [Hirschia litorea]|uniref:MmcQ/YjbR family DNA-binding protein n=1 Tax=Hirschia litorea TaxID=1199156 RepID=A0ABW2IKE7_9PROT
MKKADFNTFCSSIPNTTHVVQWGGADVWKIGGKVFAVGGWAKDIENDDPEHICVSIKVSEMAWEVLRDVPGCRPAPYLASRGMKWIQHTSEETLSDEEFKTYIKQSHDIVATGLTKKLQRELGLIK